MKLNWGGGIGAVYIIFIAATLVMVSIFMNQDVALESKDYYEQGIRYQEQISKIENTKLLPEQLDISISENAVELKFPEIFRSKEINGVVRFYRPSDSRNDFSVGISPDSLNRQSINSSRLEKGLWKIKVDWRSEDREFFSEKIIMVN